MEITGFSPSGSLLTFTTVRIARKSLEAPYVLGQVKLADGPLVFAHVRRLAADARVPLDVALHIDGDPDAVPLFWFEPEHEPAPTGG
jgi:uncharacterized OB-fold protein